MFIPILTGSRAQSKSRTKLSCVSPELDALLRSRKPPATTRRERKLRGQMISYSAAPYVTRMDRLEACMKELRDAAGRKPMSAPD